MTGDGQNEDGSFVMGRERKCGDIFKNNRQLKENSDICRRRSYIEGKANIAKNTRKGEEVVRGTGGGGRPEKDL